MQLLERRELAGHALDEVGEPRRLLVVTRDGQDVDFTGAGGRIREAGLVVGAEDRLRSNDDHLRVTDDLARRADRVLQLVAAHQPARLRSRRTSSRSTSGNKPPIGETSRISIESRSRPVITRCSPETSLSSMSDRHRST